MNSHRLRAVVIALVIAAAMSGTATTAMVTASAHPGSIGDGMAVPRAVAAVAAAPAAPAVPAVPGDRKIGD